MGERWRTERFDGFFLNTPNWTQQLQGFPYAGPDPDGFAPLAEVIVHLEDYAASCGAPVRENVEVTHVGRRHDRFVVETSAGPQDEASSSRSGAAPMDPAPRP